MEGGGDAVAGRWAGTVVTWLLLLLLLLAACSSGENAHPVSTSSSIASESTTGVSPPTVTTVEPVATTAPSTTIPVTTSPATTAPPTTTDPLTGVEDEVRAAVDRAIGDFSACLASLPNCDPLTLAATRSNPLLAVNASRVTEWNASGYAVIDRDQFRYVIELVEVAGDGRQATATVCVADGSKLVDPGAAPDGTDVIVDGTFTSGREAWDMRLDDDGVWRAYDAPLVGTAEVTDVCPSA